MQVIRTKAEMQQLTEQWKNHGHPVAFVPTMGALHEGHFSLVRLAQKYAGRVVVSIFVNPTQFAPHEDFDTYPRTETQDIKTLEEFGAHAVYLPSIEEMYPAGYDTDIQPGAAAQGLESDFRPHFFGGVTNVVARLFDHVQPDIALFGEKDFQQLAVVREMVKAYNMPIQIIPGPIARDEYGLALSSRNAYLTPPQIDVARSLNKILLETAQTRDVEKAKAQLLQNGFDKIDYVEIRDNRLLAAAWIGKTRLIDNVAV